MRAVVSTESGAQLRDMPMPECKADDILVRVRACALNRADLNSVAAKSGKIIGMEWAGEVVEVGSSAQRFRPGDRVMCGGTEAFAEYAVTDWGRACPMPKNAISFAQFDFNHAAALPIALQTMHDAVVTNGRLAAGETVLVQGASSGVGLMALQIAKHRGAAKVIGTSTHAGRRARLGDYGADLALDSKDAGWVKAVQEATGGRGVDLIIDVVSGPLANQNMEAAAVCGRIVSVGRLGGTSGQFDFNLHALKRISFIGVTFRTRAVQEIRDLNAKMTADLSDAVASEALRMPVDKIFPLDQAAGAFEHMRTNQHFGKVVLSL